MAPKRKAKAEPPDSRKKVRVGTAETSSDLSTARTTRSGRALIETASSNSLGPNSKAKRKDIKQSSMNVKDHDSKHVPQPRATQSSRRNYSKATESEEMSEVLQDSKTNLSVAGLKSKDERKDGKQYWLMKAEPEDRFENGYNVKFSIDDLAAASEPEPWDGVRNYVARNNMRAMKEGDLAFFYHSNCKVPGIVGIMRIAQEHTVDESAFDPKHPYYDQKSQRDKPRWDLVHVAFVKKFDDKISLKDVQNNATTTKELSEMELLKYKRLSVTAVKPHEWNFIVNWAGVPVTIGESTK